MWWLLVLAAFAVGAANDQRSKSDKLKEPTLEESQLTPAERDEVRRLESRSTHSQCEIEQSRLAHQQASEASTKARFAFGSSRFVAWSGLSLLGLLTLFALIASHGHVFPYFIAFALLTWPGSLLACADLVGRSERRLAYALSQEEQRRQAVSKAETRAASDSHALEAARETLRGLVQQRQSAEVARLATLEREHAERTAEERLGHEIARQVELVAQEASCRRVELAALIKGAFTHWRTVAKKEDEFLSVHASRLAEQEASILAAYQDCSVPGSTADDCMRLAVNALREFPLEIAHWLPAKERTAEKIAYVLRRYNGDYRERLLPAALAILHRQNHPVQPASAREQSPRLKRLTKGFPPDIAEQVSQKASDAFAFARLGSRKRKVVNAYRAKLERDGLDEEVIRQEVETFAGNLEMIDHDLAIEKGMTNHGTHS